MAKYTSKEIVEQFVCTHGDTYDYSLVDYIHSQTKVKIICKSHGIFEQLVGMHRKGQGCAKCMYDGKRSSASDVITKFKSVHGERYDYSLVDYKNADSKVIIKCDEHGVFKQTPYHHASGNGCPKCAGKNKTLAEIIALFKLAHGDKYDYSQVTLAGSSDKVSIICKEHGLFKQRIDGHSLGKGCIKCSNTYQYNTSEIIEKFISVHGDRYDYSTVEYKSIHAKVKVLCREHGVFEQTSGSHLAGNGCPDCSPPIGYSKSKYVECCDKTNGKAHLYLINCHNDNESFYKVGIAKDGALHRFRSKSKLPYDFNIIKEVYGSAALIWDLEKSIHKIMRDFKYNPYIDFVGKTECFSQVPDQVIKLLNDFNKSDQLMFLV